MKRILYFFVGLLLFASCKTDQVSDAVIKQELDSLKEVVLVNRKTLDTIIYNQPYPFADSVEFIPSSANYLTNLNGIQEQEKVSIYSNKFEVKLIAKYPFFEDSIRFYHNKPDEPILPPLEIETDGELIAVIEPEQQPVTSMMYKDNAGYDLQYISTDHGLVTERIFEIVQDESGFMWLGTDNGLLRYDGRFIKAYKKENGLPDNSILCMKFDQDGDLWMGSESGYLVEYDGMNFRTFSFDTLFRGSAFTDIEIDHANIVHATTRFDGYLNYDGKKITSYGAKNGLHTHRPTNSVSIDKDGVVWLTANGNGLYRLKDGVMSFNVSPYAIPSYIPGGYIDSKNRLWFSSYGREFYITENDTVYSYLIQSETDFEGVNSFKEDREGNIWMLSGTGGLLKYDGEFVYAYDKNHGLSSNNLTSLFIDRADNIWVGTYDGGLCRLRPNSFTIKNKYAGFPDRYFKDVIQDSSGTLIYASDGGVWLDQDSLISIFTDVFFPIGTGHHYSMRSILGDYNQIAISKEGFIIGGRNNGGIVVNRMASSIILGPGMRGGPTNTTGVTIDSEKNTWIANNDGSGLMRITGDSMFRYSGDANICFHNMTCIEIDVNDDIWIGSDGFGVAQISNGFVTYFSEQQGLPSNEINQIYFDKNNRPWISTTKGLAYFENDTFQSPLREKKFLSEQIKGVVQDNANRYWITSSAGVILLNPVNSQHNSVWSLGDYEIHLLSKHHGLINTSFIEESIFISSENILMIGSRNGLISQDLNRFQLDTTRAIVFLENIKINNEEVYYRDTTAVTEGIQVERPKAYHNYPEKLTLNHDKNHLTFQFSGVYWYDPYSVKYEYYLEGLETNWNLAGVENSVQYSNLDYGNYTFHLRMSLFGKVVSDELTFSFEILRPWWHTWWARLLYLLLFVLILGFILKIRTAQLQKKQRELEHEIEKATSEIRSQKDEIEEAHQEIKDSIAYAKRIQSAILPPTKLVKEYIKDSFILYKPKDIVAGDFYWIEPTSDGVLFAAADCTGHGVPGAMVSVVCNNALNRSVREFKLTEPGKILDKCRDLVIEEFEKSEEAVKDGMDIALCYLSGQKLYYSGANNPLWILRNREIIEVKADKQPIGKFDNKSIFKTHFIELKKGDIIYIFSDGYTDQFGGDKGKKFKAQPFKSLLISVCELSMEEQRLRINSVFEDWKGKLEQVDDICVIGVRV